MKTYKIKILDKRVEKVLEGLIELNLVQLIKDDSKPDKNPVVKKEPVAVDPAEAGKRHESTGNVISRYKTDAPRVTSMDDMRNMINNLRRTKN